MLEYSGSQKKPTYSYVMRKNGKCSGIKCIFVTCVKSTFRNGFGQSLYWTRPMDWHMELLQNCNYCIDFPRKLALDLTPCQDDMEKLTRELRDT